MKIVDPNVEIIQETNPLKRIELCGPWNVPGDAGGWISKARKALEVGNE